MLACSPEQDSRGRAEGMEEARSTVRVYFSRATPGKAQPWAVLVIALLLALVARILVDKNGDRTRFPRLREEWALASTLAAIVLSTAIYLSAYHREAHSKSRSRVVISLDARVQYRFRDYITLGSELRSRVRTLWARSRMASARHRNVFSPVIRLQYLPVSRARVSVSILEQPSSYWEAVQSAVEEASMQFDLTSPSTACAVLAYCTLDSLICREVFELLDSRKIEPYALSLNCAGTTVDADFAWPEGHSGTHSWFQQFCALKVGTCSNYFVSRGLDAPFS